MEYKIFTTIVPFTMGVLVAIGLVLFVRYKSREARILLVYFSFVIAYLLLNLLELLSHTEKCTIAFAKAGHISFAILPVIWLRFSMIFSRNRRFKSLISVLPFLIIPLLVIVSFYTNSFHHLMWRDISFIEIEGYLTLRADYGVGMWLYGIYNDSIYLLGSSFILQSIFGSRKLFRKQAIIIIIGITLPIIFNAFYALRLIPFLRKDFTSVSYGITSVLCFIAIARLKLFSIQPISRNYIFQNIDTGFIVLDKNKQIVDFNSRVGEIFGVDNSIIASSLYDVERFKVLYGDVFPDGNIRRREISCVEIDGRFYNINISMMTNEVDYYEGFLISITDITKEINLLKEKTELTDRVIKAKSELENAQEIIIQQEKLSTIGQLTAGIAHEINNPLSFVNSNFKIFKHFWNDYKRKYSDIISVNDEMSKDITRLQNQIEEVMKDSEDGTTRVINIIRDLLKFSRPVKTMENSYYDLNKGIETSMIMMGNQIKYTSKIVKDFGDIEKAECRENEINQVIINLLSNAVHAIKSRLSTGEKFTPTITVKTWSDRESVFCKISNNGIGIPKNDLPNLFKPFFTTKKSNEGTGLGLAISKDIIEGQYSGHLSVEAGNETAFIFSIPVINRNRKK